MKIYNVFKHPTLGVQVVKRGYCWPALLFTSIWAFSKRLWVFGVVIGVANVVVWNKFHFLFFVARGAQQNDVLLILLFGTLIFGNWAIALVANRIRESALVKRGFEKVGFVEADSPDGALAAYTKSIDSTVKPAAKISPDRTAPLHVSSDPIDEDLYEQALNEVQSGTMRAGIWAKAFAQAEGDEAKAKAAYIAIRVDQLRAG